MRCALFIAIVPLFAASPAENEHVVPPASLAESESKVENKGTYTVSAAQLKARVAAESAKVEKARTANQVTLQDQLQGAAAMTQAQRLEDMASFIEKSDTTNGADMIKALGTEAKSALSDLQAKFVQATGGMLEKLGDAESKHSANSLEDGALHSEFDQLEHIMAPLKQHMAMIETQHPELQPWTKKVGQFSSIFEKDALKEMFGSPLTDMKKYKEEFMTYEDGHQKSILELADMAGFDDLLTVLEA